MLREKRGSVSVVFAHFLGYVSKSTAAAPFFKTPARETSWSSSGLKHKPRNRDVGTDLCLFGMLLSLSKVPRCSPLWATQYRHNSRNHSLSLMC